MTATADAPRTMQRPGGRAERVRGEVHQAVLDLLRDRTVDELTIPLIAERSGVHQATIYRRWSTVGVLLDDVVAAGPARTAPLPDTGTLRRDLDAYAVAVADSLTGPLGVLMLRGALANPDAPAVFADRRAQLRRMLARAGRRGETPPGVDELLDVVVAPLYLRALFGRPPGRAYARRLVDRLLGDTVAR